jgi:hypothetical protein
MIAIFIILFFFWCAGVQFTITLKKPESFGHRITYIIWWPSELAEWIKSVIQKDTDQQEGE